MISIIIPVYNVEKYLKKCINSVLNQTYKNLEIILVDDGSTDNSGRICDEYKLLDSRIKVIHKKNGGLSDARNYGLEIASGEYVAFLDSDDWIDKNLYYTLYKLLKNYDADITVCNFKSVYTEEEKLNFKSDNLIFYNNIDALKELHNRNHVQMVVAWNKLYKKNLFKKNRYPYGKIHEDEFLTPVLLNESKKIVYLDKELIYYRQRQGSIMNSSFSVKRLDLLEALEFRVNYYKNNKLFEIYEEEKIFFVNNMIKFYYLIKKSDLQNKKDIMNNIRQKFIKTNLDYNKSIKHLIKINLFKYLPNIYVDIVDLKNRL